MEPGRVIAELSKAGGHGHGIPDLKMGMSAFLGPDKLNSFAQEVPLLTHVTCKATRSGCLGRSSAVSQTLFFFLPYSPCLVGQDKVRNVSSCGWVSVAEERPLLPYRHTLMAHSLVHLEDGSPVALPLMGCSSVLRDTESAQTQS